MGYDVLKLDSKLRDLGIPITGVDCNGTVYFLPEATEEQRTTAIATVQSINPNAPPSQAEVAEKAKTAAEAFIERQGFSAMSLIKISRGVDLGSPKAAAIEQWINLVIAEGLQHASNPNYEQFTPPPYTYFEVLLEIQQLENA